MSDVSINSVGDVFSLLFLIILIIFIICWVVCGIVAFFYSIICITYKGTMTDKLIGFLLALTTGPVLYFAFYIYNPNYCLKYT